MDSSKNTEPAMILRPGGVRLFPLVAVLHFSRNSTACSKKQYAMIARKMEARKQIPRTTKPVCAKQR